MTRILIIEPAGNLWGSEQALLDLLDGMRATKIGVCLPSSGALIGELSRRDVEVYPYLESNLHLRSKWWWLYSASGVFRACVEFRPHAIYLNQSGAFTLAMLSAYMLRIGIFAHVRLFEDAAFLAKRKLGRGRLRGVIAISKAIEKEIRRFPELSDLPIHTIYDSYSCAHLFDDQDRQSHKIACVGQIVPVKGQDVFVRAIIELQKVHPKIECLMIGDGDKAFKEQIKTLADSGGASIDWVGFSNSVMAYLERCSVLVCPSWREPLGRVIFEAWDAGAIPVAFRGSEGAAEILIGSEAGILYDEQTPSSLARAIDCALTLDPSDRARMVASGRQWLNNNCNTMNYGKSILEILSGSRS